MAGAEGWARLERFLQLEDLWCFHVNEAAFIRICDCVSLKNLYVDTLKSNKLRCLQKLSLLRVLSLDSCAQVDSLAELGRLEHLEGLAIIHFKNVHDVGPLSNLTNLQELAIAGSMWTRMKIASLHPLSSLTNLKYLHLTNLKVADESLKPLAGLSRLELLEIANFYPMEEFAWLSGKLRHTKCAWFHPYVEFSAKACARCGQRTLAMLSGKGKPILCRNCDHQRLERHVAGFMRIAATAR
jgi:hypothetical protein